MRVIMCKGLPASGKTTWAKEQVRKHGYKRVNKDDLRAMIDCSKWSKSNEDFIVSVRNFVIMEALGCKKDVIIDDTNFEPKHEAAIRKIAETYSSEFEVKFFDTPVEECIKRDARRENPVGEEVIRDMYHNYLYKEPEKYPVDPALPNAIICDIDGTLAKMKDRKPFEWHKVGQDELNPTVAMVLYSFVEKTDAEIILMSGRDEVCRKETEQWLRDNSIMYTELYMRPEGNNEKDSVIKTRLFDEHVRGRYNVELVLDDRNQVVETWRSMGLTCFQVADGNF